jgi:hypothetical protein
VAGCLPLTQFIQQWLQVRFDAPILFGELADIALELGGKKQGAWQ